jgi:hypothetical protein
MKVKELIKLLQQVDQELPVYTTYDTWCCTDALDSIIELGDNNPSHYGKGIYLTGTDVDFIMNEALDRMTFSATRYISNAN